MTDEIISNLEPIEEGDMNLKEKFIGGGGTGKMEMGKEEMANPVEKIIEKPAERKEGVVEKEAAYSKILSKIPTQSPAVPADDVAMDATSANSGIDAQSKVTNLVKIAETKGIAHAVKVARHMEDNYTLDEFHDKLLGEELHSALVTKGIIKEI
jgi:hypothetical protein